MTSRDRVARAIEFRNPDRTPILHAVLPAAFIQYGQALADLLNEFPNDFRKAWTVPKRDEMPATYQLGTHTDEWGCVWNTHIEGMLGMCVGHPLADWSNWPSYKLPDIPPASHYDRIQQNLQADHDMYAFGFGSNIFERMQFLRGYDNLMTDIALRSPEAYILRDALTEWATEQVRLASETDADGMPFGDDWGTQLSLIISPAAWRDFYKPAYVTMFEPAKAKGKHVHFHTDGYTWAIIQDFVEIGVNVLNVQQTIMDVHKLGKEFGGKVAFRSDLDRQRILPHGTRQEIRDHVKEVIDCLGSYGGGLIGHGEIGPDVPLENIRAMLEAWHDLG